AWVINNRTLCQLQTNHVKVKYTPYFVPPSSELVTKEALPIVDRKKNVKPLNMREVEERILITTSAVNGRTATQKMNFIWSESQNISTMIS
ncbi:hypothetical protein FRC16_002190, partial [Serendipita sp. 398]